MTRILLLIFLISGFALNAQTISDFENLNIDASIGFLNGSDEAGGYQSGNLFFPNNFDPTYSSWSGWAISSVTDNTTPGFGNQYSAIPGMGQDGSLNYATSFSFGANSVQLTGEAAGKSMKGMYVTNSTYAYFSMQDGDAFSKKFGGASGDDPDYFLLTIKGTLNGEVTADSIDFYLADFRSDDNSLDYIVDEWTYIDLSSLGELDDLLFSLSSTDNGQFGMNTPAYFCVDNLESTDGTSSVSIFDENPIKLYPNPASSVIHVDGFTSPFQYEIIDQIGRKVLSGQDMTTSTIALDAINQGIYFIVLWNKEVRQTEILKVE